jgi:polynucleotide 5'-hydroxyl-kinase GRC3/NOL9
MSAGKEVEIPPEWEGLELDKLKGVILVLGGTDTGKTTLVHYLRRKLVLAGRSVSVIDGDPGQGILGPPGTMNMVTGSKNKTGERRGWFVGSTSPRGHMLPLVVGAQRLVDSARQFGMETIIYDTTGLVDRNQGGIALKSAKIDLLRPTVIITIQGDSELEELLEPLRRLSRVQLIEMEPASAVIRRNQETRRENRARRYASYFSGAKEKSIFWPQKAVLPGLNFRPNCLLGFEGKDGFLEGLGIFLREDRGRQEIIVLTPLKSFETVETIRVGDVAINHKDYQDKLI